MTTDTVANNETSFWANQFAPRPTYLQIAFDFAFGLALPLLCCYFDPIVFRASSGEPLVGKYAIAALIAVGLGLFSLTAWLLFRWPAALLAGFLAGGATLATLLGLLLLPMRLYRRRKGLPERKVVR